MDDIAESYISRFISQLKVRLVEVFEVFNIELALPLLLNSKQCKKLLGIANETEFQRVSHLKDFQELIRKGRTHDFHEMRWLSGCVNWKLI